MFNKLRLLDIIQNFIPKVVNKFLLCCTFSIKAQKSNGKGGRWKKFYDVISK